MPKHDEAQRQVLLCQSQHSGWACCRSVVPSCLRGNRQRRPYRFRTEMGVRIEVISREQQVFARKQSGFCVWPSACWSGLSSSCSHKPPGKLQIEALGCCSCSCTLDAISLKQCFARQWMQIVSAMHAKPTGLLESLLNVSPVPVVTFRAYSKH